LIERLHAFAKRPCLLMDSEVMTYGQLAELVEHCQDALRSHRAEVALLPGDFTPMAIAALLACLCEGLSVAPVREDQPQVLPVYAQQCGATVVIRAAGGQPLLVEAIEAPPPMPPLIQQLHDRGGSALVLFSSGSTGKPKAMAHAADRFLSAYQQRRARQMTIALFLQFDHIGGLNTLLGSLAAGMSVVPLPRRDPDSVAHTLARHQVRVLPTTPTFLNLLLMAGHDGHGQLSCVRVLTYGAEAMPQALLKRLKERFPKAKLLQTFGTSETGIARTAAASSTNLRLEDPDQEHKVVDGELWLRSRTQVLGYLGEEGQDRFTEDGWFRTGDLVEAQADGSLRLLARKQQVINVGGEKATPTEIESVLLELPQVAACKVYGVPSPLTGQSVAADIVPAQAEALSPAALRSMVRRHARQRLQQHKVPTKIKLCEQLAVSDRYKALPSEGTQR
jgi:acyl-coenzyme A synthetase/AMP-(fatty) acid ligase